MPTLADHLRLWAWCLTTLVAAGFPLAYMPLSTQPAFEALSERPEPLTALFYGCALGSTALWWLARGPRWEEVRPLMASGVLAGWLLTGLYTFYVYAFSQSLAEAPEAVEVGEVAPDFEVTTPDGRTWSLAGLRGRTVLLVFYRGSWCPFCTRELEGLRAMAGEVNRRGGQVIGVSSEPFEAMRWEESLRAGLLLLADPELEIIRRYGLEDATLGLDVARPATYVVDAEGRVVQRHLPRDWRLRMNADDYRRLLEGYAR